MTSTDRRTANNADEGRGPKPVPRAFAFGRSRRLTGDGTFGAIMAARAKCVHELFAVYTQPNDRTSSRLGISISRKVGNATVRNHIKRLVREAFRLRSPSWGESYDVVLVVKPHAAVVLTEYQTALDASVATLHALWIKRGQRKQRKSGEEP